MRKKFIWILVLILVGAEVAYIFRDHLPIMQKSRSIEEILPTGPLLIISVKDVDTTIQKFAVTKFWQKIQALDYETILQMAGSKPEEAEMYLKIGNQLLEPNNRKLLSEFFGREIAIAVYPMKFDELTSKVFQEMIGHVTFVTRLKPRAKFAQFITSFMSQTDPDVRVSTAKYKEDYTITSIVGKKSGVAISYVVINDLLVFGVGDGAAKACVNVLTKSRNPLSDDKWYQEAKASALPDAEMFSYLNFYRFINLIKDQVMASQEKAPNRQVFEEHLEKSFRQVRGFQTFGYSSKYDDLIRFKIDVHFNKAQLDPGVAKLYSCPPAGNESLAFIPANAIAYQWNNCYNLNQYWEQSKMDMAEYAKLSKSAKTPEQTVAELEQSLGLSIEKDILPAVGNELGGALLDVKLTEAFPIPQLLLFMQTPHREKVEKVITALLSKQSELQILNENYQETTIKYFKLPLLVINLEPAYTYLGKYFVLSTDRQLLKQAVDSMKNGSSLTVNPKLKEVNLDLTGPANSSFFVDFQQLMQKLNGLVDWADQWAANQETKRAAFKTGSQKRLTDLESDLKTQEAELENLRTQLRERPATDPTSTPTIDELKAQIQKKEPEVVGARQKVAELKALVDQYSRPVQSQSDKQMVEAFIKPMIQAFESWGTMASTTQIKEGVIEMLLQLKVE